MQSSVYTASKYVEVIGSVNQDQSLREMKVVSFGDSFDLDLYNQTVTHTLKHRDIFG